MKNHHTQLLILKKVPYGESSLIVNCLSGEFGRVDILVKGARRLGKKKFPEIDIFNEISISFRESQTGTLHTMINSELLSSAIDMANFPNNLGSAINCAGFIIANTHFNMHTSRLYMALKKMISDFSEREFDGAWRSFIRLIYLDEQGFLPRYEDNPAFANFANLIKNIIEYCEGRSNFRPPLSERYILKLQRWTASACRIHAISDYF
jgi:recombinational DNA repair protein (RecF pathway)